MINFGFSLSWPCKRSFLSHDYYTKDGPLWSKKHWEVQFSKMGCNLIGFQLDFTPTATDHAGLYLSFSLLGHVLIFNIYDIRHWNREEHRWYKDGEETW